jgi:hypothetical protein
VPANVSVVIAGAAVAVVVVVLVVVVVGDVVECRQATVTRVTTVSKSETTLMINLRSATPGQLKS